MAMAMHPSAMLRRPSGMQSRRRLVGLASAFASAAQAKDAPATGLFGVESLRGPASFAQLNADVRGEATRLCEEALPMPGRPKRTRKMVQIMDDLSNSICCAADLVECTRLLHPEPEWKAAADASMADFTELVETLNTSAPLYRALHDGRDEGAPDDVDARVARLFLTDFQASGVHLPTDQRAQFVELSGDIFHFGATFTRNADLPVEVQAESGSVPPAAQALLGTQKRLLRKCRHWLTSPLSELADPDARRWGYETYFRPSEAQEECLKALLVARARLARLTGFGSYAARAQQYSLLEGPEEIHSFLTALMDALRPRMEAELGSLGTAPVAAWDYPALSARGRASGGFGLPGLMDSLGALLDRLYGLKLHAKAAAPGELWDPAVTKLAVSDENDNFLGHIYCDFFDRPNKLGGDCHFTVRCSKALPNGENQTPMVVLSLSFSQGRQLSISQAENLYHEVGHAIHSMLGRTRYQHVSGTRCATDLAETPSNLMERLFYDPRVMSQIRRDPSDPTSVLSPDAATALAQSLTAFAATDLTQQASYALLDLELHRMEESELTGLDTVAFFGAVQAAHVPGLRQPPSGAWHHRFSHLVTYGAKYHSYLVAKGLSFLLYRKLFAEDPFSRRSGDIWAAAQGFGGEKPTKALLKDVLGFEPEPLHLVEAITESIK